MLVLSRSLGEKIQIDEVIELTVLEIRNDRVRLGFCAPPDVPIHREEVYRRICAEREENARSQSFAKRLPESDAKRPGLNTVARPDDATLAQSCCVADELLPALPASS